MLALNKFGFSERCLWNSGLSSVDGKKGPNHDKITAKIKKFKELKKVKVSQDCTETGDPGVHDTNASADGDMPTGKSISDKNSTSKQKNKPILGDVLAGDISRLTENFGPSQEDFSCGETLPLSGLLVTCFSVSDPDSVEFKVGY